MIDSWYYATCVKFNSELLNSHHLLYNAVGVFWLWLAGLFNRNPTAIIALNQMNAIAATTCLFVLYACLKKLNTEKETAFWLSLFCGVSFGFMRYATDAETYILPLLFSLIATFFLLSKNNWKNLILAGLFASLAILIHQLHIWWALAMFFFLLVQKPFKFKQVLLFGLPFLLIPFIYYAAFMQMDNPAISFVQFITGEYSKGNAGLDISLRAFLFTIVNFIRTFIQVHGQIACLFNHYTLVGIIIIACCLSIISYSFIKNSFKVVVVKSEPALNYSGVFLIAFILHLLFAFLSSGNAEFMVMLPFLIVLYLGSKYRFERIGLIKTLTTLMLLWNLTSAIIPNALLNINRVDKQVEVTEANSNASFLWKNKPLVENVLTYKNGFNHKVHFIGHKILDKRVLDSLLENNTLIYTDFPNTGSGLSRESLLSDLSAAMILRQFHLKPTDSFENLYGKNYIYLIQKRVD